MHKIVFFPTEWFIADDYTFVEAYGYTKEEKTVYCRIPFIPYIIVKNNLDVSFNIVSRIENYSDFRFCFVNNKNQIDELYAKLPYSIDSEIPMLKKFFTYTNIHPSDWISATYNCHIPTDNDFSFISYVFANVTVSKFPSIVEHERYNEVYNNMAPYNAEDPDIYLSTDLSYFEIAWGMEKRDFVYVTSFDSIYTVRKESIAQYCKRRHKLKRENTTCDIFLANLAKVDFTIVAIHGGFVYTKDATASIRMLVWYGSFRTENISYGCSLINYPPANIYNKVFDYYFKNGKLPKYDFYIECPIEDYQMQIVIDSRYLESLPLESIDKSTFNIYVQIGYYKFTETFCYYKTTYDISLYCGYKEFKMDEINVLFYMQAISQLFYHLNYYIL